MKERCTISLGAAITTTLHGSGDRVPREYLEFVVDGEPLLGRIGEGAADYASVLGTNWPVDLMSEMVRILLGEMPSELADARVPLYVCAECGGLGCGTITAVIEYTADTVTWRDFGWQTDYDPFVDREPYSDVGPFRFARGVYEATLGAAERQA